MESCGVKRQLCSVKHQIYHPRLPSLRQMDMDTVLHRLTNEHCRHTTYISQREFLNSRSTGTSDGVRSNKINAEHMSFPRKTFRSSSQVENLMKQEAISDNKTAYTNYSIIGLLPRKKHCDITSSWRTTLEVKTASGYRRPSSAIPATMFCRYRNTTRPYSSYPWY